MAHTVLHIDSSARQSGSTSRVLTAQVVERLNAGTVIRRDLSTPLPLLDEAWIGANFTPADQRSDEQKATLALSDSLIDELKEADTVVIGVPIYNFTIPTTLKAWIDLVARARKTFKYTESGPVGLLEGKTAYVVVASGGTAMGSEIDFATPYLRHVLGFLGIHDVTIIAADQLMASGAEKLAATESAIDAIAA